MSVAQFELDAVTPRKHIYPAPVHSVENSELHEFSNSASRSGHQAVMQSARA